MSEDNTAYHLKDIYIIYRFSINIFLLNKIFLLKLFEKHADLLCINFLKIEIQFHINFSNHMYGCLSTTIFMI